MLFAASILGDEELVGADSACGMLVSAQADRLRRELASCGAEGVSVLETDLYGLEGVERDAARDAVVAGASSPFVFVDGRLVCTGTVDATAVIAALD